MEKRVAGALLLLLLNACGAPVRGQPPPPGASESADAGTHGTGPGAPGLDLPATTDAGVAALPPPPPKPAILGLVLPSSGRSRALGQQLAKTVEALYGTGEDRPEGGPELRIRDGSDPEGVKATIAALAAEEQVFAAVGLFDGTVAEAAAEAAAEHELPLVMLTLSDAPVQKGGLLWRAMPTPVGSPGTELEFAL